MMRTAKAHWAGNGMQGEGTVTTQSGVLNNQPYTFKLRFENADGKAGTGRAASITARKFSFISNRPIAYSTRRSSSGGRT